MCVIRGTFPSRLLAHNARINRAEAKKEAEKERPGLVMFTDGSRLESEAAGYAVAWKNGQTYGTVRAACI